MKICAVFPLLPDPTEFINQIKERYPEADIAIYSANHEAIKRAAALGVAQYFTTTFTDPSIFPPPQAHRECFDRVVFWLEKSMARYYLMFLVQTLFWRGPRRDVIIDGEWQPFHKVGGLILWLVFRYLLPNIGISTLLAIFWLLFLPITLVVGALNGRPGKQIRQLLTATFKLLSDPLAYLNINPRTSDLVFRAAFLVLLDFARGADKTPPSAPRKLLLIRLDHLGDLIMTTGHIAALKEGPNPWEITLIVGPWGRAVYTDDRRIDHLLIYPSRDPIVSRGELPPTAAKQRRAICRYLRRHTYDLVVDPAVGLDSTALLYLPRARKRLTTNLNRWFAHGMATVAPPGTGLSERDRLTHLFAAGGRPITPLPPKIELGEQSLTDARKQLEKCGIRDDGYFCLHPGGNWPGRLWPIERFAELARQIYQEYDMIPIGLFGPGEEALAAKFLSGVGEVPGIALQALPLKTVFAIISFGNIFIGNDSGLMHAATALGVPTVGVFGPGDKARWRPYGKQSAVASIDLACSPCYQVYCTDQRCLQEMPVETVYQALQVVKKLNKIRFIANKKEERGK